MQVWRNWQTRMVQVHMNASSCRFKSCYLHQNSELTLAVGSEFFILQDLNLKKARAVKKNSTVYCFLGEWCEGGYRMRKHWVAEQCILPKARCVLSGAPKRKTRFSSCLSFCVCVRKDTTSFDLRSTSFRAKREHRYQ